MDYGNWVSRKLVIVPGILGLGCAAAVAWSPWLLLPAAVFLLVAAYFTYARWAFSSNGHGIQRRMLKLLVSRLPDVDGNAAVLDIGCGSGALAIRIAQALPAARVVGIDTWGANWGYSKARCEFNAQAEAVADRVSFQEGNAACLPFDDGSFDVVVSNFVFHEIHSVKDKRELLREALRVLKPGGVFAIQDLFLWKRVYGPIDELVAAVGSWDIERVKFLDTSESNFIPAALKLPFMLGTAGILYGEKPSHKSPSTRKIAKVQIGQDELVDLLREQVQCLQSSVRAFDEGSEWEAKRLAVSIRVLVHDTKRSHSLLQQLRLKSQLEFHEITTPDQPGNLMSYHGLVGVLFGAGSASYYARLDDGPPYPTKRTPFENWWNRCVLRDAHGSQFSRKDLVLTMANKEGGAHVDPELNAEYARLSRDNSLGWHFSDGSEPRDWSRDPVPHSVRQIAHELLKTLHEQVPEAGVDTPHGWGWRRNGLP